MLHGWEKMRADERRKILEGIRDNAVYGGPYHAEFSPTDACNYECFFCNSGWVDRSKRLPWDIMESTLRDLIAGGLRSIRLAGGGEPLIYPEIENVFQLCLENRIDISNLTTNGYRLTPKIIDYLLRLDASEIIISFNDVDEKRYATTNGTTERAFGLVMENIRNLVSERAKRKLTRPRIVQQFFLWKGNYDQIERAYDIGESLGVDHIYVRDMYGIEPEKMMTDSELRDAAQRIQRLMDRDRERGLLSVSFPNEKILNEFKTHREQVIEQFGGSHQTVAQAVMPTRKEYCYVAWYSVVVRGNGEVFPCCFLASRPGYPPLGNVKEQPLREIWTGPKYAQLRTELREIAMMGGSFDPTTRHCFTIKACSLRDACPLVASLASPEFYSEVIAEIEALRRTPSNAIRRASDYLSARRPFIGATS